MINVELLNLFKQKISKSKIKKLKSKIKSFGAYSVPVLLKVMKEKKFSDQSKWVATFLLGQVVGKKSTGVLVKYTAHPNWVLRLASLRTLFSLNADQLEKISIKLLKDRSWLIRDQALDIINTYSFNKASASVWAMLYDKRNYNGKSRGVMIGKIITTIGELRFKKALKPLLVMSQKKKYTDLFSEIDRSLSKITGKSSPQGNKSLKKRYWKKVQLKKMTILDRI